MMLDGLNTGKEEWNILEGYSTVIVRWKYERIEDTAKVMSIMTYLEKTMVACLPILVMMETLIIIWVHVHPDNTWMWPCISANQHLVAVMCVSISSFLILIVANVDFSFRFVKHLGGLSDWARTCCSQRKNWIWIAWFEDKTNCHYHKRGETVYHVCFGIR